MTRWHRVKYIAVALGLSWGPMGQLARHMTPLRRGGARPAGLADGKKMYTKCKHGEKRYTKCKHGKKMYTKCKHALARLGTPWRD